MSVLGFLIGPARARLLIAGTLLILGFGRLGMFSYSGTATTVPAPLYGWLMVTVALSLILTARRWRLRVSGRLVAGFGVCALAGLGADLWAGGGSLTSVMILFWLAVGLLVEAVAGHDC